MTSQKAPFITFEGGEGSGKTTQIALLYQALVKAGLNVATYREPGGTEGSEEIRRLILKGAGDRWTARAEALLMSASRAELVVKRLVPHLEQGTWVICDRFTDSTMAYQGYGHGLGYDAIEALNRFTVRDLVPDLTFIFQLDPEAGLARTSHRIEGEDRYENLTLDFHRRVAKGYQAILDNNPHRCVAIDAQLDIDTLSKVIFDEVIKRFEVQNVPC